MKNSQDLTTPYNQGIEIFQLLFYYTFNTFTYRMIGLKDKSQ